MKTISLQRVLVGLLLLLTSSLSAQTPEGPISVETTVKLGLLLQTFAPLPPRPPVTVTVGAKLTVMPHESLGEITSATWYRGLEKLAGTSPLLSITPVTDADAGVYRAELIDVSGRRISTESRAISVTRFLDPPLVNISSRHDLARNGTPAIVGFVVHASKDPLGKRPDVLIRVVGPTLAKFGLSNALPDPSARLYDATGREISMGKAFPAVIYPDGTTPESRYKDYLRTVSARLGAFAVPLDGSEFVEVMELAPGAYTLHGASRTGQSGTVLLEIYQIPSDLDSLRTSP